MKKNLAAITGIGGYVPDFILTNKALESMVDTTDEWITSRTGISERHILKEPGKATSDLAVGAAQRLLDQLGMDPMEVDMIICATVTEDMSFPDTATLICHKLGAKRAFGFDLHAACSGFLFALTTGAQFIEAGTYKKVMVIGADMMSSITDYTDRATCILFGDGGGAVMLQPAQEEGLGIVDSVLYADGEGKDLLYMKAGGSLRRPSHETVDNKEHYIYQDGRPVFKKAVAGMVDAIQEIIQRNNLTIDDIDWIVPHQANMRILTSVAGMLDVSMDKVMVNIHHYGNTTAATIPLCLWDYRDRLKKGDRLILTAFGGGFTWGATYLRWAF
jgi:3-oxoacyl-[acyl-carrier-protein] synthase III